MDVLGRGMLALLMSTAALGAGLASADAIGMGECEHGWVWARHGHGGGCEPVLCASDAECGGGRCTEIARCVETSNVDIGDAIEESPRRTYERPLEALCSSAGECGGTAHCRRARECVPRAGGGCAVSAVSAVGPRMRTTALAILAAMVVAGFRRRRPRT